VRAGPLDYDRYQTLLHDEVELLVAAAGRASFDTAIASYPRHTVGSLACHVGVVMQRVQANLESGRWPVPEPSVPPSAVQDPPPWVRVCMHELMSRFDGIDPDAPVEQPFPLTAPLARNSLRYVTLEVAVHRYDMETPSRVHAPLAADLADDGIAHLFDTWFPQRIDAIGPVRLTGDVAVHATDTGRSWVISSRDGLLRGDPHDGRPTAASMGGTAHDVLLALWKRVPAADRLECTGDGALLDRLLSLDYVPDPRHEESSG
jgi:hypothetical protein